MADQLAGWLSFPDFYGPPTYHRTAEVSVYVAPDRQRLGIGRQLLGAAVQRAPELGLSGPARLHLRTQRPSLRLFARFGFAPTGRLPEVAELDGVTRDLVIVQRRLR